MKLSYCTLQYKKTDIAPETMLAEVAAARHPAANGPGGGAAAPRETKTARRYDGIEWLVSPLETMSPAARQALGQATRQAGLQMPVLGSYIGHYNLAMTNRDEVLATAEKTFGIAHDLQIPRIRCFVGFVCECSSIGCKPDYWAYNVAGFRDVAAALGRFNKAHKTAYRLVLETHSQSLVDTVAGCRKFLNDVGSDLIDLNMQLGPDMLREGIGSYLDVAKALRKHIVHVHTQPDTIATDKASLEAFRWLAEDGYTGFFSVEGHPPWPNTPAGPEPGAALAQRRLVEYTAAGL